MHHGYDIRVPSFVRRALFALSVGLVLCLPARQAHAISAEGLVMMPSVQGVLIAIANVNRAMRDAAENPMDKWRREAVQSAIRAMPPAIVALAADFKAGQLHDKDFPMVQAMLGGFVDVNAADNYKKFLNKPSADLIPKVGNGFPANYLGPSGPSGASGHQSVTFDDNQSKGTAPGPVAMVNGTSEVKAAAMKSIGEKQDKVADLMRVTFDDDAKKAGEATAPHVHQKTNSALANSDDGTLSRLERAMASSLTASSPATSAPGAASAVPAAQAGSASVNGASGVSGATIIRRAPAATENSLDDDFFGKGETLKKGKPRADYQLKVKPKYWNMSPYVLLIESLMIKEAHAEGGCQDCGGEGGGGGGGQAAAQILMGIAAIISAIAPMVVAGIQAEAEKEIAATQAKAQIEMTNISANTSKFISNQNTQVTLQQTAAAERINKLNQDGVSGRLDMQLAELRSAREDAASREKDRLAEEKRLNAERIALAQKQADDNLKLARQSLNAQLTQAGLTSGFGSSRNSSTGGLTSTTLAGNVAANSLGNSVTTPLNSAASSSSSTGIGTPKNGNATTGSLAAIASNQASSTGLGVTLSDSGSRINTTSGSSSSGSQGAGISIGDRMATGSANRAVMEPDGRSRLLTSASGSGGSASSSGGGSSSGSSSVSGLAMPNVIKDTQLQGGAATRALTPNKPLVASANDARALSALLNGSAHRAIRGSSNGQRVAITSSEGNILQASAGPSNSDLTSFTEQAQTSDSTSFAAARRTRVYQDAPAPQRAEDVVARTVLSPSGVHNPPSSGHGHGGGRAITD